MEKARKRRLEARGWKVGNAREFLGLTPEEAAFIDLKLALSEQMKEYRRQKKLTQVQVAKKLQSSQSRVAKMEAGDSSVSLDLLVRSLFALGATPRDLARMIAAASRPQAVRPKRANRVNRAAIP